MFYSPVNPGRFRLLVNDSAAIASGGLERFSIQDLTAATVPFTVEGGAPQNALWVADDGAVGLGTSLPASDLHIAAQNTPALRLEQLGAPGYSATTWIMGVAPSGELSLTNPGATAAQIKLGVGLTGDQVLSLTKYGETSLANVNNPLPDARLHMLFDDGTSQLKVEEISTNTLPRTLLNLQNNGRPEIIMGNTSTNGEWSFGAGTNFILKQGTVGSASAGKVKLFEIDPSGNAILTGSLTTGGTTCGGGCDAVFDPDYDLPSITEHAAQMFARGHLPNMGPMKEGQPFNLTDKFGRLLNEVEHAHIYIAQQADEIAALRSELAALKAELRRAD